MQEIALEELPVVFEMPVSQPQGRKVLDNCGLGVMSQENLYIWHCYAGRARTSNDLTMVTYSTLFTDIFTWEVHTSCIHRVSDLRMWYYATAALLSC